MLKTNRYSFNFSMPMSFVPTDVSIKQALKDTYQGKVYKYGIVKKIELVTRGYISIDNRDADDLYVIPLVVDFEECFMTKDYVALFEVVNIRVRDNNEKAVILRHASGININGVITPMGVSSKVREFIGIIEKTYINCRVINDGTICLSQNKLACNLVPSGKILPVQFMASDGVKIPQLADKAKYEKTKFLTKLFILNSGKYVTSLEPGKYYSMDPFGISPVEHSLEAVDFLDSERLQNYLDNTASMFSQLLDDNLLYVEKSKEALELLSLYDKL